MVLVSWNPRSCHRDSPSRSSKDGGQIHLHTDDRFICHDGVWDFGCGKRMATWKNRPDHIRGLIALGFNDFYPRTGKALAEQCDPF